MNLCIVAQKAQMLSALRSRDFRLYWFGYVTSISGLNMLNVAHGWLVYELTGSELLLGAVGLARAIPATALTLFGGVIADKVDQRRFAIALLFISATTLLILATLTATELVQIGHILGFIVIWSAVGAFQEPALQSLFPHLIRREDMVNAVGLNATVHPGTNIAGPAFAGLLIATVASLTGMPLMGAAMVYYLAAAGYMIFGIFLFFVRMPRVQRAQGHSVFKDLIDGMGYIWHNKVFLFLIWMIYFISFFGLSYVILLPIFAEDVLRGGPSLLGFLYASGGAGSLAGALIGANLGNFRRRGWVLFFAAALLGASLIVFALSSSTVLSLVVLPLTGMGFSLYSVTAMTIVQLSVQDEFRGRVMAVWTMTYSALHPGGMMMMGALASFSGAAMAGALGRLAGAPAAVALGGLLVVTFALLGATFSPTIRNLSAQGQVALYT